jgi:lipid II:glycine glycyltransferase (peptidoglycan interpeptide bridge formation enzyme)
MNIEFVRSLTTQQQQQWSDLLSQSDHAHPRQHFQMGQIEIAKGRTPVFAVGLVDDQLVIAGLFSIHPLWFGGRISLEANCLSGPVFNDPVYLKPFLAQVIDYFGQIGVGRISMTPYWFYPEAEVIKDVLRQMRFLPMREPIPTGLIELNKTEEEFTASFTKNARKKLRRLEKHPIHVYPIKRFEDTLPLFQCLSRMRSERAIMEISRKEFQETYLCLQGNPRLGCWLRADYEQTFIAGTILLCGVKYAHGVAYAINPEVEQTFPKVSLGFSLWWQSILWLNKQGSLYYDVDVYEENAEPAHPLYAVYQFKRQFMPVQVNRLEPYSYEYKSVTSVMLHGYLILEKIVRHVKSAVYVMKNRSKKVAVPRTEEEEKAGQ